MKSKDCSRSFNSLTSTCLPGTHAHTLGEREHLVIKTLGEQRIEKVQAAEGKEVSVVENMESDIKVIQFNFSVRNAWMADPHAQGDTGWNRD